MSQARSGTSKARKLLATVAATALSALFVGKLVGAQSDGRAGEWGMWAFVLTAVVAPAIGGGLIWTRWIAAQLLARGIWWSFLLASGLMVVVAPGDWRALAAGMFACSGVALLAAGQLGLDASDRRFQPVAFRRTLLVALVLAMADTGALLWFGLGNAIFEGHPGVILLVPSMIAGIIGLLRLRTWGLLVSLGSNIAFATIASLDLLDMPPPLRNLFVGTALLQLAVPTPMIISIVRARRRAITGP